MSKKTKIAINGFGRIGRAAFKIILNDYPNLEVVAINDLTDIKTLAYLLKYDSAYGKYNKEIKELAGSLKVAGKKYKIFNETDPENLPWKDLKVDIVLECTGIFKDKKSAGKHLSAGAKKVIISAPTKDIKAIKTVVLGVNDKDITKSDDILSCASCTTNCLAPMAEVVRSKFGVKKSLMTTIHAYTASQSLVDGPHKDLRRGRAGAINIVPTSTGAAKATGLVIKSLNNKLDGMAMRVPILVGSIVDATFVLKKKTDIEKVKKAFISASKLKKFKGILQASTDPIVSSDIVGSSYSSIVDLEFISLMDGDLLKVVAWYDNEWGYSNRLVDLSALISRKYL
ncbi:MAG TPA: type I glyceraldehyde-3-phosphate dehydrogenase [Patescibacteria group bacterium]|nr:type I glyceraldehyde-3-phosphate dehydrogenase [Patescibacteria group bacterium]